MDVGLLGSGGGLAGVTPRTGGLDDPGRADGGILGRQRGFSDALGQATGRGTDPAGRARSAAEQFVAVTFVEPILKQLRETSQAAPPFAPTQGEKQFRALLDAKFAHQIVRASRFPLVDRLAGDLLRRAIPAGAQAGGADPPTHRAATV
jgi:Rod binding domain-containing protein